MTHHFTKVLFERQFFFALNLIKFQLTVPDIGIDTLLRFWLFGNSRDKP